MKILVADDSQTTRKIMVQMLAELGMHSVEEATDGQQALDRLQSADGFDLLLTDWNMPNLSGLDLALAVRADERLMALPILMVTTRSMQKDILAAMKAGVNGYITKPFDAPTLQTKIARVTSR